MRFPVTGLAFLAALIISVSSCTTPSTAEPKSPQVAAAKSATGNAVTGTSASDSSPAGSPEAIASVSDSSAEGIALAGTSASDSSVNSPVSIADSAAGAPEESGSAGTLFGIPLDSYNIVTGKVKRNQFISSILSSQGVEWNDIEQLLRENRETFDPRKVRTGSSWSALLTKDTLSRADYFIYQHDPEGIIPLLAEGYTGHLQT